MKEPTADHPREERGIRCPRLGHQVTFDYCRIENLHGPCSRALVCWSEYFDVESFFRGAMSAEEYDKCFHTPPIPKLVSLVDLIEQAKRRHGMD
jgi:hypothetical protein